ncbi:AMP-dependent synthetase/ligase [Rhizohabitans arisaemae]|uniref:AMP-dependent synthetase/ligase n=1 Tax=Rhizohabitans arisaemae TaxID=2720610 RepID=UPI0024B163BA|nr:long-chain fatty acid--CoA ligase [Rhizohabitans arisaemae]
MREYNVPGFVEIPDHANCVATIVDRAERDPGSVVFLRKVGPTWTDVTVREFADQVSALAKGMIASGIESGDRVAIMGRTRYEWTLIDYAVWAVGAVSVPIYENASAEQIQWVVSDSGTKAVFAELDEHEERIREVLPELPELGQIWRFDRLDELNAQGAEVDDAVLATHRTSRKADDLATIIYTSGTTGMPKGCRLTHRNLLFTSRTAVFGALKTVFTQQGRSTILFLPLAHSFARIIEVGAVESSTPLGHTPDLANVAPELLSFRPLFLLSVPRVFEKVYNRAEQKAIAEGKDKIFRIAVDTAIAYSRSLDGSGPGLGLRIKHAVFTKLVYGKLRAAVGGRLTGALSGGSALGERLGHFFRGVGIEIYEGYGLTETSAPTSVNTPELNKIGSVGKPLPGTTVAIAEDGEVLVKGDHVFDGYWNNEEATAEVMDEQGWFHTGDIGELDSDGYLRITGRKKEIIVTAGGKNVAPAPLEDRIRAHPLVSQCVVVGDDRPFIGALISIDPEALDQWRKDNGKPGAVASGTPEIRAAVQKAVDEANRSVSKAESIRKFVLLDEDLTVASGHLTPSLKLKRNVVAQDFAEEIESIYRK